MWTLYIYMSVHVCECVCNITYIWIQLYSRFLQPLHALANHFNTCWANGGTINTRTRLQLTNLMNKVSYDYNSTIAVNIKCLYNINHNSITILCTVVKNYYLKYSYTNLLLIRFTSSGDSRIEMHAVNHDHCTLLYIQIVLERDWTWSLLVARPLLLSPFINHNEYND